MSFIKKSAQKIKDGLCYVLPTSYFIKRIMKKRGVIILMYHSVPEKESTYRYITQKKQFEEQVELLSSYFKVVSIASAYEFLYQNKALHSRKPLVVITFDDGYKDNYQVAYPALRRYSLPFTIFLTTDFINNKNHTFMSWDDVKDMSKDSLVTFGAHTQSHVNLSALEDEDKESEIVGSGCIIADQINKKVDYFAYPSGGYDDYSMTLVEQNYLAGFKDRTDGNVDVDKRKIARISIDGRHSSIRLFLIEIARSSFLEI